MPTKLLSRPYSGEIYHCSCFYLEVKVCGDPSFLKGVFRAQLFMLSRKRIIISLRMHVRGLIVSVYIVRILGCFHFPLSCIDPAYVFNKEETGRSIDR